jgi:murein DD-endopeptidase MepM/ murein hydrolase activator NlpD
LTAQFGEFRTFNGTNVPARHTGWDLRAPVGTEVRTMGAGVVAYAGLLDIRGNHVVIDHGYGIYSGYSHLSQIHVTRGQTIYPNQIIGVSGNTGRSGGPHLHWEIAINGKWVDSADFLQMWLP